MEALQAEMLVMKDIRPSDFRAYGFEIRQLWIEVFEQELSQLHMQDLCIAIY